MNDREPRAAEVKRERRRRGDVDTGMRRRLPVDESKLDHANFVYRHANDDPARIRELTEFDDYDPVPEADVGGPTRFTVGAGENNSLRGTVLLRKAREHFDADQRKKDAKRDQRMSVLQSGQAIMKDDSGGGLEQSRAYVPPQMAGEVTLGGTETYKP